MFINIINSEVHCVLETYKQKDKISKDFNWHYAQLLALIKQYRVNYCGNISLHDDVLLEHACATVPYWGEKWPRNCLKRGNCFEMVELSLKNQIIQYQE